MLSYTFINMHSQVSHTGPKGPLVVLCVCGGGGGWENHAGEGYTVCGSHMGLAFGCICLYG